jgi:hypothetical protein
MTTHRSNLWKPYIPEWMMILNSETLIQTACDAIDLIKPHCTDEKKLELLYLKKELLTTKNVKHHRLQQLCILDTEVKILKLEYQKSFSIDYDTRFMVLISKYISKYM